MSRIHDDRGLTLIETLAALTIFAIITVGITPLLASSLRGSTLSRSYTVGKDLALEGMERARSLPYFVAFQTQPKKVDALDIYFPCADPTLALTGCAGEGTRSYDAATGIFTITCSATTTPGPTCALPLPEGYTLRYEARFVRGDGSATVFPPASPVYKRDPSSTEGQLDIPPSQLMDLRVTASWTISGATRSFTLQTLLGDRKFGDVKMAGVARINYAAQVQTSYVHTSGDTHTSDLKAIAGVSESRIETKLVSNADQRVRAAEITLVRRPTDDDPDSARLAGSPITGAIGEFRAPPTQTPIVTPAPNPGVTVTHPNLTLDSQVAFMNTTSATDLSVTAANELPAATGGFGMSSQSGLTSGLGYFWVQNQADTTDTAILHLDPTKKMFSLKSAGVNGATAAGETSVISTALGAGRKVEARAVLQDPGIKLLRALPVTFVPGNEQEAQIVIVKDFTASVTCTSLGGPGSTAIGSWQATIKIWRDTNPSNNLSLLTDMAATNIVLSGALADTHSNLRTVLARPAAEGGIGEANPLIYDGPTPATDVYLFEEGELNGYLTDFTLSPVSSSVDAVTSAIATAGIEGALQITTVPTNPSLPESGLSISVGSLSCEALDRR